MARAGVRLFALVRVLWVGMRRHARLLASQPRPTSLSLHGPCLSPATHPPLRYDEFGRLKKQFRSTSEADRKAREEAALARLRGDYNPAPSAAVSSRPAGRCGCIGGLGR